MNAFRNFTLGASALTFVGFLLACSGGDPVSETHTGSLTSSDPTHEADGSYYDEYSFYAKAGWKIHLELSSSDFDAFLQLRRSGVGDDEFLEQNDDAADGNTDSMIDIVAPASGTYLVWANTYDAGQTGDYTLKISAQPAE